MTFTRFVLLIGGAAVILWLLFVGVYLSEKKEYRSELSQVKKDFPHIRAELAKRRAGDGTLTKTYYGYRFVNDEGKVFKVVMK